MQKRRARWWAGSKVAPKLCICVGRERHGSVGLSCDVAVSVLLSLLLIHVGGTFEGCLYVHTSKDGILGCVQASPLCSQRLGRQILSLCLSDTVAKDMTYFFTSIEETNFIAKFMLVFLDESPTGIKDLIHNVSNYLRLPLSISRHILFKTGCNEQSQPSISDMIICIPSSPTQLWAISERRDVVLVVQNRDNTEAWFPPNHGTYHVPHTKNERIT